MKDKFYYTKWFMWLMLIFIPPVGIVVVWTCHKDLKNKTKVIFTVLFLIWSLVSFVIFVEMVGDNDNTPSKSLCLYDDKNVEVKDVINGSRTEQIGEYSIVHVKSTDITVENLTDWYFNYVIKNDYNWCMILYSDKNDNSGIYANNGFVSKNVTFSKDKYGEYMLEDSSKEIIYTPTKDNKLKAK